MNPMPRSSCATFWIAAPSIQRQLDGGAVGSVATKTNDTFINAEVSILTSWDLAVQVAEALGPKRVLPDAKGDPSINACGWRHLFWPQSRFYKK